MKLTQKWSVCLKNNILGAADVMSPTIDPYDPAAFYISDGWNTSYAAMRLRKLSLETGEELANALVRSAVRYIDVNPDTIYALLDKRILKLDRKDLKILENHNLSCYKLQI